MNPNKIGEQLTKIVNVFPSFCNRINASALNVWRREQKRAMLGIGMKRKECCNDDIDQNPLYQTIEINNSGVGAKNGQTKRKGRRYASGDELEPVICTSCRPSRALTAAKKLYYLI